MTKIMRQKSNKLRQLLRLDREIAKLPKLSPIEGQVLESEQRFESVYHSNKLEGNKLSKLEARKVIL